MTEPTEVEAEFFPTPRWAIDRMTEALAFPDSDLALYIDPCVGGGAIPDALPGRKWTTVDIRETGRADVVADYTSIKWGRFDVCIMNPPFSRALEFADKAIGHCNMVVMLQRLNWLATGVRAAWMTEHTPSVNVLPNRIDFTGGGGDSQEYAWFVWDGTGETPAVRMLAVTPKSVRVAQKPQAFERIDRQQELFT